MVTWKPNNTETNQKQLLRNNSAFLEIRGNPSKVQNCWGISEYFESFFQYLKFHRFLVGFHIYFFDPFPLFTKLLKSQFINRLPQIFGPFLHIFNPFPLFSKTYNLNVLIGFLNCLVPFLVFLIHFPCLQKLIKPQYVDWFLYIFGSFPHIVDPFPLLTKTFKISIS